MQCPIEQFSFEIVPMPISDWINGCLATGFRMMTTVGSDAQLAHVKEAVPVHVSNLQVVSEDAVQMEGEDRAPVDAGVALSAEDQAILSDLADLINEDEISDVSDLMDNEFIDEVFDLLLGDILRDSPQDEMQDEQQMQGDEDEVCLTIQMEDFSLSGLDEALLSDSSVTQRAPACVDLESPASPDCGYSVEPSCSSVSVPVIPTSPFGPGAWESSSACAMYYERVLERMSSEAAGEEFEESA